MKKQQRQTLKIKYKKQVEKVHYQMSEYIDEQRWLSYYFQMDSVRHVSLKLNKEKLNVLEIGVGNGLVTSALKLLGHRVATMDFAKDLDPDIFCALPKVPTSRKYDCIICCEVLEHMQYQDSLLSLKNIARIAKYVIVSIPDKTPYISFVIKIPLVKPKGIIFSLPFKHMPHKFLGEHYWELGTFGIGKNKFLKSVAYSKLTSIKDFRIKIYPWHHFFILKSLTS